MNVLPQLAGPTKKIFLSLPLPLRSNSRRQVEKTFGSIRFSWRSSSAHVSHFPLHCSSQVMSKVLHINSILVILFEIYLSCTSAICHILVRSSCKCFLLRLKTKVAISSCPSSDLLSAANKSWLYVFMSFLRIYFATFQLSRRVDCFPAVLFLVDLDAFDS